jgi:hypothetical protein
LRAALQVTRRYDFADIVTRLELRAGERAARVTTAFENRTGDHRLRTHFALPQPADRSEAECAFAIVERGLTAEGGPHEVGVPAYPSRRFVRAGGLTVVHEGLIEYELVEGGRTLALTLLRSVGMLAHHTLPERRQPAGPALPVPGAQLIGPRVARYAVAVGDIDPFAFVDDVFLPFDVAIGLGIGDRPALGQAVAVHGAEVSAVRRRDAKLEVRVWNPTGKSARVTLGARDITLRPWEVQVAFAGA